MSVTLDLSAARGTQAEIKRVDLVLKGAKKMLRILVTFGNVDQDGNLTGEYDKLFQFENEEFDAFVSSFPNLERGLMQYILSKGRLAGTLR